MLIACLTRAVPESGLVHDIAGHCALNDITFKSLAAGHLSASAVASMLYLTEDEAVALVRECKSRAAPGDPNFRCSFSSRC